MDSASVNEDNHLITRTSQIHAKQRVDDNIDLHQQSEGKKKLKRNRRNADHWKTRVLHSCGVLSDLNEPYTGTDYNVHTSAGISRIYRSTQAQQNRCCGSSNVVDAAHIVLKKK